MAKPYSHGASWLVSSQPEEVSPARVPLPTLLTQPEIELHRSNLRVPSEVTGRQFPQLDSVLGVIQVYPDIVEGTRELLCKRERVRPQFSGHLS